MRISERHRCVFVSIPKCGTNTIYWVMEKYFRGKGVHRTGFHPLRIPEKYLGYFRFVGVRNPFTRAVSIWWRTVGNPKPQKRYFKRIPVGIPFPDFAARLRAGIPHYLSHPQARRLKAYTWDAMLRMEHLEEDFMGLPFVKPHIKFRWPVLNPSVGCPEMESLYSDPATVDHIREWGEEDFKLIPYYDPQSPVTLTLRKG